MNKKNVDITDNEINADVNKDNDDDNDEDIKLKQIKQI